MDLKIAIGVNERFQDIFFPGSILFIMHFITTLIINNFLEIFKSKVVYDQMHFTTFYFSCNPFLENRLQGLSLLKNVSFTLLAL
jgi:hypothetical protein